MELEKHDKTHKIIELNQGGFKKEQGTNEHTYVLQTTQRFWTYKKRTVGHVLFAF